MTRLVSKFIVLSTLALLPTASWAGSDLGSITFAPMGSSSIPTMGGIGLLLLALVLGVVAVQHLRENGSGSRTASLMAMALASGALFSAAGGVNFISQAAALTPAAVLVEVSNPAGQTLDVSPSVTTNFRNISGVELAVTALTLPTACESQPPVLREDDCKVGTLLADGESCPVSCELLQISDRRLKTDIRPDGSAPNGLPLYTFRYLEGSTRYRGVMAQDVLQFMPEAVRTRADGYMAVNYGALGLEMTEVD